MSNDGISLSGCAITLRGPNIHCTTPVLVTEAMPGLLSTLRTTPPPPLKSALSGQKELTGDLRLAAALPRKER